MSIGTSSAANEDLGVLSENQNIRLLNILKRFKMWPITTRPGFLTPAPAIPGSSVYPHIVAAAGGNRHADIWKNQHLYIHIYSSMKVRWSSAGEVSMTGRSSLRSAGDSYCARGTSIAGKKSSDARGRLSAHLPGELYDQLIVGLDLIDPSGDVIDAFHGKDAGLCRESPTPLRGGGPKNGSRSQKVPDRSPGLCRWS